MEITEISIKNIKGFGEPTQNIKLDNSIKFGKVNLLVEHIIAGKKVAVMFFDWSLFVSLITYEKRRFFIHLVN